MAEIRVNVDDAFFDELKKKLGGAKTTDVIQDALALLNWGADASKQGRDIVSADADRSDLEKVVLPRLASIKAKAQP